MEMHTHVVSNVRTGKYEVGGNIAWCYRVTINQQQLSNTAKREILSHLRIHDPHVHQHHLCCPNSEAHTQKKKKNQISEFEFLTKKKSMMVMTTLHVSTCVHLAWVFKPHNLICRS
jgi:ABC-type nickel/cobalt efflux system permease component RcnA